MEVRSTPMRRHLHAVRDCTLAHHGNATTALAALVSVPPQPPPHTHAVSRARTPAHRQACNTRHTRTHPSAARLWKLTSVAPGCMAPTRCSAQVTVSSTLPTVPAASAALSAATNQAPVAAAPPADEAVVAGAATILARRTAARATGASGWPRASARKKHSAAIDASGAAARLPADVDAATAAVLPSYLHVDS